MAYKIGVSRAQINIFPISLDEGIAPDNVVRVIDTFVDWLDLEELGFQHSTDNLRGTSMYPPSMLLKLYLYGYLNRIRSSRRLETECYRNIELHWLLHQMTPGYHTISDFRKDNPEAIKGTFKRFTQFCIMTGLIEGETVAFDGTKIRAQNNAKNNFNAARLEKLLDRIDIKTQEYEQYLKDLDESDTQEAECSIPRIVMGKTKEDIEKALTTLKERGTKYKDYQAQLQGLADDGCTTEQLQISTIDPDARAMPFKKSHTEVGYNIQTAGDAKQKLIVHFEVTNVGDQNALATLSADTKEILNLGADKTLNALADAGYHTGEQLALCTANGVITFVAPIDGSKTQLKSDAQTFSKDQFIYDAPTDTYTCPHQQKLTTNSTWYEHKAKRKGQTNRKYKQYTLNVNICQKCPFAQQCHNNQTKRAHGRCIERFEHEDAVEANRKRVEQNRGAYKQRKEIIEHPFGTVKRSWGCYYTLLKTKKKVTTEFALIFLCYNIRRVANILGNLELKKALICRILSIMTYLKALAAVFFDNTKKQIPICCIPKGLLVLLRGIIDLKMAPV